VPVFHRRQIKAENLHDLAHLFLIERFPCNFGNAAERTELGWDIAGQVAAPGLWLLPALALAEALGLAAEVPPVVGLAAPVS
jgi:hypothetical protein